MRDRKDLANKALGAYGEAVVADWYRARGYTVVARNWRCREGEIDLILVRDELVVFCEVKTRRTDAFGLPAEAVGWKKQQRLRRLAARWLAESGSRSEDVRFDVASVVASRVTVIESAF